MDAFGWVTGSNIVKAKQESISVMYRENLVQYYFLILSLAVKEYVNCGRQCPPELTMSVSCWHTEERSRDITETDSNGHTSTRTETYTGANNCVLNNSRSLGNNLPRDN